MGRWLRVIVTVVIGAPALAMAQSQFDEEELSRIYGDEEFISIATGRNQPIARAPAVASVLTAEDIRAIGATDIDQILETVPGLHVSYSAPAFNPIYVIRGIHSQFNPRVLLLINGIPATNVFVGNRGQVWGGMPVNNISRIEVVRGPGSALYGADAYSGVINIVTKTASEIEDTTVGARTGSFDYAAAWLLHGGDWSGFETAFSIELYDTDGADGHIQSDAQSGLDALFGTSASLAPGNANSEQTGIETRLDISKDNWRFRVGYQGRRDVGSGAGTAQTLDPSGSNDSDRINADVTHRALLDDNWELTTQLSYFDTSAKSDLVLLPPGHANPFGTFPDGVIGNPYVYERHTRLGVSGFYSGFEAHQVLLGAGFNYADMYKVRESKNFSTGPGGLPIPLGSVMDVSNDPSLVFIQPQDRDIVYTFAQDEWAFATDWNLTAGMRFDHYSDFGNTINPRLAVIWQTRFNVTSKLLYGRAFRPPSFAELYNINNPVALGNRDLDAETIDTIELSFDVRATNGLRNNLSFFRYSMDDIIRFVPDAAPATTSTAQNTGEQSGYGLEWETVWEYNEQLTLRGNYAFQRSRDRATDSDAGHAPHHQVYVRGDRRLIQSVNLSAQANWVIDRERAAGDTRPQIDDYVTVDTTLRYQWPKSALELAASIRNLFDEDAFEPSPAPGLIPNDLPLPGRSFFVEASYRL